MRATIVAMFFLAIAFSVGWSQYSPPLGLPPASPAFSGSMTGGIFLSADGAVGGPGYSFASETSTGWYRRAAGVTTLAVTGGNVIDIAAGANKLIRFPADWVLDWSNTSGNATTAPDVGISRPAAGVLKITDGSSGAGRLALIQSTPSASSDACTAGSIWTDAGFIYVCTASGTIKRAALSTF